MWGHKLTPDDVSEYFPSGRFFGNWGGIIEGVTAGDVVVMPYPAGGEVYAIKGPLFDKTYALEDPQSRVPTHEEAVVTWSMVLRNKKGSLYRKSELVYIEADHFPAVQTTVDERVIELSIEM